MSVFIAARNEARVIRRRIDNLLEQEYPGPLEVLVVSDASDDGTDGLVEEVADPRVRLLRQEPREGKTAGINRLAREARGEIFIQTDANVIFAPGAVRALVEALTPPEVGVAIGRVRFTNEDDPLVAAGEGLYWRFENWTKRMEAERGLLAVANGGIYALRRDLWQPLPAFISGDAAEPLLAARAGYRTVVAEGALAYERAADSHREEFQRKARIIAQQVACARWIGLPGLPVRIAWAYLSHKLLRYLVAPIGALGLIAGLAAAALGSVAGAVAAALLAAPLLTAPLGLLPWPGVPGKVFKLPLYLVTVNLAAAAGLWRGLRGRAQATWEVPDSTRRAAPD
ncbi:MAG: glycosyltransferase [Acidobacteriota bacterium]|nr:glycosyltransferase [Acidobacteriota bacterium]